MGCGVASLAARFAWLVALLSSNLIFIRLLHPSIFAALAYLATQSSTVLLKNADSILPLTTKTTKLGVVGDANNVKGGGSGSVWSTHIVTPTEGILAHLHTAAATAGLANTTSGSAAAVGHQAVPPGCASYHADAYLLRPILVRSVKTAETSAIRVWPFSIGSSRFNVQTGAQNGATAQCESQRHCICILPEQVYQRQRSRPTALPRPPDRLRAGLLCSLRKDSGIYTKREPTGAFRFE